MNTKLLSSNSPVSLIKLINISFLVRYNFYNIIEIINATTTFQESEIYQDNSKFSQIFKDLNVSNYAIVNHKYDCTVKDILEERRNGNGRENNNNLRAGYSWIKNSPFNERIGQIFIYLLVFLYNSVASLQSDRPDLALLFRPFQIAEKSAEFAHKEIVELILKCMLYRAKKTYYDQWNDLTDNEKTKRLCVKFCNVAL